MTCDPRDRRRRLRRRRVTVERARRGRPRRRRRSTTSPPATRVGRAPGARSSPARYGDDDGDRALLERRARSTPILHCAADRSSARSIARPGVYYRENVVGGVALLEAMRAAGVRRARLLVDRGRVRRARAHADPGGRPAPPDQPVRRDEARRFEGALAGTARAYGLRSVLLRYFNVAGATERNGEVHRPETHLIPNVLAAAEGGRAAHALRRRLPDPGRHADPRLHPRRGPRGRAPRRPRGDRPGRPAHGPAGGGARRPDRQPRDIERVLGPRGAARRPRRSSARRSRTPFGPRRAGDPSVLVASDARRAGRSWAGRHAADARGDDRVGVGVARGAPRRLRGLIPGR